MVKKIRTFEKRLKKHSLNDSPDLPKLMDAYRAKVGGGNCSHSARAKVLLFYLSEWQSAYKQTVGWIYIEEISKIYH